MNAERFAAILEAYGSDARRWPAAERRAAEAFGGTAEGLLLLGHAAALDEALDAYSVAAPGPELRARVLEARPAARRGVLALWPWPLKWAPGALAAAGLAGVMLGAALSQGSGDHRTEALLAEAESFDVPVLMAELEGEQL